MNLAISAFTLFLATSVANAEEGPDYVVLRLDDYFMVRDSLSRHVFETAADSFTINPCGNGCNALMPYCCANGLCAEGPEECGAAPGIISIDSFSTGDTENTRHAMFPTDPGMFAKMVGENLFKPMALAVGFMEIDEVVPSGFYEIQADVDGDGDMFAAAIVTPRGKEVAVLEGTMKKVDELPPAEGWTITVTPCCLIIWNPEIDHPYNVFEMCWCDW